MLTVEDYGPVEDFCLQAGGPAGHTKQPGPIQLSIGPESMQHLQPDCSDLINVSLVYGQSCSSSH
jgi:hypothetical protein